MYISGDLDNVTDKQVCSSRSDATLEGEFEKMV